MTLSRFLDGELKGFDREMVEKHLSFCPACRQALIELGAPSAVLKSLPAPVRKPARKCLPDETIAAWLEDRLDAGNRRRVISHLAECPDCAARAGRIAEDLEAVAAVRQKGLERVPEELSRRTEALFGRGRSFLGRVAVELERVASLPGWWRELTSPYAADSDLPYRTDLVIEKVCFDESSMPAAAMADDREGLVSKKPAPRERWDFRMQGLRLEVGFGEVKPGFPSCLVRVLDESGRPAGGAAVTLKGAAKPFHATTDRSGLATLGPVDPGRYLLRVDFGPGAEIEIEAR